jgi:hypothetical protein
MTFAIARYITMSGLSALGHSGRPTPVRDNEVKFAGYKIALQYFHSVTLIAQGKERPRIRKFAPSGSGQSEPQWAQSA